ncbi:GDSL family lipase [bacterium]|nr:GDSL family lipase [bacterium]
MNRGKWTMALMLWVTATGIAQEILPGKHPATTPVPREAAWMIMHQSFNERAKKGDVDLLFLGDSITQGWANNETWKRYYDNRKAVNMGIGGDRTEHVLWRLDHGNVDGISPKVVVLMIGTNNSGGEAYSAEQIGDGIVAIVQKLRTKLPETKILLLAIFPRGENPNPQREKNASASARAAKLADDKHVYFLDIGAYFLDDKGHLAKEIMPDYLHLSPAGYKIWARAIESKLAELLGDKPVSDQD